MEMQNAKNPWDGGMCTDVSMNRYCNMQIVQQNTPPRYTFMGTTRKIINNILIQYFPMDGMETGCIPRTIAGGNIFDEIQRL